MDLHNYKIRPTKHFILDYMRTWDYDVDSLKKALQHAYKIDKVGKKKYEAYVRKNGSKKIVFVFYFEEDTIFVITGSEGG